MRKEYDFSKAKKNPYASQLKKQITIRLLERAGMHRVETRSAKSHGKRCTEFVYNAYKHNVG